VGIETTFFYKAQSLFQSKRNIQPKICMLLGHRSYPLISFKVVQLSTRLIHYGKFSSGQIN